MPEYAYRTAPLEICANLLVSVNGIVVMITIMESNFFQMVYNSPYIRKTDYEEIANAHKK
ncbi:hypothetical protein A8C56_12700 [Niabella ginsenosidivorans]|uniref:Uncharacterized protein n=1 Tax=Niabella ginsenosidivorans TaxID=1176587 RepID=A0A1A9I2G5_9BACT|nr:hypothetical protein A8C56_12700 [Niabella ginsenosidivorans]